MKNRQYILALMMLLVTMVAEAQIRIGGNVYGGGNEGNLGGKTAVTVRAGDIDGSVYGGARQADVGGSTFVHIDGEHMSGDILINYVYGGNDIAGTIGTSSELPTELTETTANGIDNSYNAFVLTTKERTETVEDVTTQPYKIYIGQLFGGGNGDYDYSAQKSNGKYDVTVDGITTEVADKPELGKAYLEVRGGSCVLLYGGGNNVTVKEATDICIDNPSTVSNDIYERDADGQETATSKLNEQRMRRMGIYALGGAGEDVATSTAYQFSRVFGGNNKAAMAIRPTWHLKKGKIRNLYSGGNRGAMTHPKGILLTIPSDDMEINNVYGGCRMADVNPANNTIDEEYVDGVYYPPYHAARVYITGGNINNVYGGNDISGVVYGGNAVGIHSSINGNVYGGGNGSYPYTDNTDLKDNDLYGDFYYDVNQLLGLAEGTDFTGLQSAEALNKFRPNAESATIRVSGTAAKPLIIRGSIYCGGNSATLRASSGLATAQLKIGSYVFADKVFLGSNGENMVKTALLEQFSKHVDADGHITTDTSYPDFSQMDLTQANQFAEYMKGCEISVKPNVVFDSKGNKDPEDYQAYSTYFGSFYCGGNVGSVRIGAGTGAFNTIDFNHAVVIFGKLVGGCNSAYVKKTAYNAAYDGGIITDAPQGITLTMNLSGLKLQPMRWPVAGVDDGAALPNKPNNPLVWNTIKKTYDAQESPVPVAWNDATWNVDALHSTMDRRLYGGNIYGGCYESGHVDGNVVININSSLVDCDGEQGVFDSVSEDEVGEAILYDNDTYHITETRSGVILDEQGMDVLGAALNVYGGGYGEDSEIWGGVTINVNKGYVFQIFGGGELGAIGKGTRNAMTGKLEYDMTHGYNSKYSTCINLHGSAVGRSKKYKDENMAECEFIYGGGFEGLIMGDTRINLGNGRVFNTFAGSCNADILGHTETYVGQWQDGETTKTGFPWIRDHIYGGNDLGGRIRGTKDFASRVRTEAAEKMYSTGLTTASAYMEYTQGRLVNLFGGCYGDYDYTDYAIANKPYLDNAFVNIRANEHSDNVIKKVFGAGQGHAGERAGDKMQNRSYVLVDIPDGIENFKATEVFGAGSFDGLGMHYTQSETTAEGFDLKKASAIIDLVRGRIGAAYGGSYNEGFTRRTVVNVPEGSTIQIDKIFGGAYGMSNNAPCDVYEANVNWNSSDALCGGYRTGIYGGNNNARRTLYGKVNINAPVYYDKENTYYATVYGAGYGKDTWSQYTEVNLNEGARLYEVYGGGQLGRVMNKNSVAAWKTEADAAADAEAAAASTTATHIDLSLGEGYTDNGLTDDLATYKYNTNVRIGQGADVCGYMYNGGLSGAYAYGGGLGDAKTPNTGDVYGTTYIGLFGGKVTKDLYAAGTVGSVNNRYKVAKDDFGNDFIASANAYIEGGTARNVYGGGWQGSVGYHPGAISATTVNDVLGETNVIIGKLDGTSILNGIPAIERNAYGGGEGGAVFGTTHITLNKGYIGYSFVTDKNKLVHHDTDTLAYIKDGTGDNAGYYQEKLDDETWIGNGTNRLYDSGCIFGGGYIDNSNVDVSYVKMMGGHVRNSLFGGGEIAAIGRGIINASGVDNSVRTLQGIYKAGQATVELYEGQVHRNVFGGGRGYNNLGEGGTLYSDGYVFGQTEVHIYGGEVGSDKGMEMGYGNVFGGGDIGYVYSAYEQDGKLFVGIKDGKRYDDKYEGYYYAYDLEKNNGPEAYIPAEFVYAEDDPKWVKDGTEYVLTEDCKVLVEPHPKATSAVTINGHSYAAGQYVLIEDLNTLGNKNSDNTWNSLDPAGIIIHNAVFAGGNTSSGSSTVYANTTTVFGNATASINDVYHRDLITLGTGHTGGLYGDGNLTFVDGYRGLNITNYGTDYYSIAREITIDQYKALPAREAAYYELRYQCTKECIDNDGTAYYPAGGDHTKASTLTADDIYSLFKNTSIENFFKTDGSINTDPTTGYWKENGVLPVYAGRLMNTIQRADFCGVFGSRMVMQGAQDRVPEIVDHTNYTINRVREVSLNQQHSKIVSDQTLKEGKIPAANLEDQNPDDYADLDKAIHGNYFGIYNIVNYLGALTSDVHFMPTQDSRRTDNADTGTYGPEVDYYDDPDTKTGPHYKGDDFTYYNWKKKYVKERKRNNGISLNKLALASGVYLELYTEKVQGTDLGLYEKDWGYITGVIELDLINVQPGIGGGFVYAKNEHRVGTYNKKKHTTLTALNADAITRKDFDYEGGALVEWETSGNFVHGTQTIIDDCYNISGKYSGSDAVPAHYWYIKGSVYVYDQYISAYTGAPNAYSKSVDIPLTITAASHGTMKLLNVMSNKYAYYSAPGVVLQSGKKVVINDVEYHKNDPISYWDWYLLTRSEQALFVDDTYVTIAECQVGNQTFPADSVLLPSQYKALRQAHPTVYHVEKQQDVDFDFVFRSSNNLSHDTGYILTYKVNNPPEWNTWYTEATDSEHDSDKAREMIQTETAGYEDGPTYHLTSDTGGVLGQRTYNESNIISKEVYDTYQQMVTAHSADIPAQQAQFEPAYIVTTEYAGAGKHLHVGAAVSATEAATMTGYVAPAYICTGTIQLSPTEYIYLNARMTEAERTAYYNRFKTEKPALAQLILDNVVPAYYCTQEGLYGGNYYEAGKNYRALGVWCSMSPEDREQFAFNYDAFDLLIDSRYSKDADGNICYPEGQKYQYDAAAGTLTAAQASAAGYSLLRPVDYSATYHGTETTTHNGVTLQPGKEYPRLDYEKLPNEKRHYAPIEVKEAGNVYVVNNTFQVGNSPYAVGTTITANTYNSLGETDQQNITTLTFTSDQVGNTYYYCRESYKVGEHTEGVAVTNAAVTGSLTGSYADGATVPIGLVIDATKYGFLTNKQTNFTIHGIAPTETSTLYVSRFSDIFDLSKDRIITVVYQYDYEESDESGAHVTPVSERHVVNIHLQFKSGVPSVEAIKAPQIVLPGTYVALREPHVTPGAYEVTGGGWKLFEKSSDAESHTNGIDYTPNFDPLYWYQDGFYVAYYAKTYLGETYSNHVQVSVANYHDLDAVMKDKTHHLYVDNPRVKRDSKIYIDNRDCESDQTKSELDLLKDFFDLSVLSAAPTSAALEGHANLDAHVHSARNLEFFLRSNVSPKAYTAWVPIGDDNTLGETGHCFEGILHGDGYTISGLDHSLFGHLCGEVYNLGVTGSFTSAGIADEGSGYLENCWISTSDYEQKNKKALFATPSDTPKRTVHLVNCYYPQENQYMASSGTTEKPLRAFYNGEVTYNLNGFYLFKRYCDHASSVTGNDYNYYTVAGDKTLTLQTGHYANVAGPYLFYDNDEQYLGSYVESRFADGDFQYADGTIPNDVNERYAADQKSYYPIWPDDYLFFGQALNYDHVDGRTHQDDPSAINRSGSRILTTDAGNRVFRAPAYYRSGTMGVAYFNPYAVFAQSKKDADTPLAYQGMTAIDFSGGNGDLAAGYQRGTAEASGNLPARFYPPLLDDGGLSGFLNIDLTKNLLVYTGAPGGKGTGQTPTAAQKTANVVSAYLTDAAYTETHDTYRTVAFHDPAHIRGHWVQQSGSDYVATNDHLLVDRQDFNAPMAYQFATGKRMWYQRVPDNYVDRNAGWEAVSLPFAAEVVTSDTKGELTHFYQGSETGHEYWLREYKGNVQQKKENNVPVEGVYTADFDPLAQGNNEKDYTNTFLFDWYYSQDSYLDRNADEYQKLYYSAGYLDERYPVTNYPYAAAGTPYLIGFPGRTYYEFDLSGTWTPENVGRYPATIPSPGRQYITFASVPGTDIAVSDTEQGGVAANSYTFRPTYLNNPATAGQSVFQLCSDGSGFEQVEGASSSITAFRPYFTTAAAAKARRLVFNSTNSQMGSDEEEPQVDVAESVDIRVKKHQVIVTSHLRSEANVRIVNAGGISVATFTVKPGQTVVTPVEVNGVYIVQVADGRIQKKIAVR